MAGSCGHDSNECLGSAEVKDCLDCLRYYLALQEGRFSTELIVPNPAELTMSM